MKTVTFAKDYDHRLNATQVAAYRAGETYPNVPAAVIREAQAKGALPRSAARPSRAPAEVKPSVDAGE